MIALSTPWLQTLLVAVVAAVLALVGQSVGRIVLTRIARGTHVLAAVVRRCESAARLVLPLAALQLVWHGAPDDLPAIDAVRHTNGVLLLAALTWAAMSAVQGVAEGVVAKHPVDVADNLRARRIGTQAAVLSRTVMVVVFLAGVSLILMTFPGARQLGASLLASAGVAGLVVGLAARPLFSNLIAGMQIALAQPLRLDDVLIVQGEWGRVEEITGTYVVLRIWDERRLIIPLQWFIENPFQNWTRTSAAIIGTVFLHVDYAMPMEPLRAEAKRLCESSKDWDRRLCLLQVTEAGERTVEVRVLVTSVDSSRSWDLRCFVREGLVSYVQREYPQHLPILRTHRVGETTPGPHDRGAA
ncbi:MAG TPA: mechanosensitive ion channel domain-containing protein [Caldimonas sp.]|nr:mechanosensitive ion channel domain-containing protein [Caldimonas sp.]HEV7577006.1 mechanosensitive ion channel domain-containing protein [Caldimonas sp.]